MTVDCTWMRSSGRGKLPLFELTVLADAVTISAHKLGGPQGVGAIIVRDGVPFEPIVKGGGQERRRRAGTENAIGIAGFGAACEAAALDQAHYAELATFRDKIEADLGAQARVYGDKATRLNNTTCIGMPGCLCGNAGDGIRSCRYCHKCWIRMLEWQG